MPGGVNPVVPEVEWRRVRGVVFDLDGTLYDPLPLRLRMAAELLVRCGWRPSGWREIRRLRTFRRLREELAGAGPGIARRQYELPAERLGEPVSRVEATVREWVHERPLAHLRACRKPGVAELFGRLRDGGRKIAVFSDYPVGAKLAALGLAGDAEVAAEDPEVDRLKPDPASLARALELLGIEPAEALVIGDRDERDGEAARRLGCPYLILSRRPSGPREVRGYAELLHSLEES